MDTNPPDGRFHTGARRESILRSRFDCIPLCALERIATRFALGAEKYGENNWQRGLPDSDTFNHAVQHLFRAYEAYRCGLTATEDDFAAAIVNIVFLMYFQENGNPYNKQELLRDTRNAR